MYVASFTGAWIETLKTTPLIYRTGAVASFTGAWIETPISRPEKRKAYLDDQGRLRIPLDADDKYRWWQGGQSVFATLLELGASNREIEAHIGPISTPESWREWQRIKAERGQRNTRLKCPVCRSYPLAGPDNPPGVRGAQAVEKAAEKGGLTRRFPTAIKGQSVYERRIFTP